MLEVITLKEIRLLYKPVYYSILETQGRPQDLGGGGARIFFLDLGICMSLLRSHAHC